ncbi:Dicer-like protein 1 [Rhizophlyctis rosea]|uniref:Dicer-like protein 1 n=1 Tax=Rhizophlyctis rosea TaxID=64517 RepID=A0AAD5X634_9FUNG|nr:Dicer-like protein 1 [Rhizophlyctis rosea]
MHDDTHLTGLNASAQQPRNHIDFASASAFPRVEEGLQAHGDDETVFKKDKRLTKGQIRKLEDEFYKGILVPRQYQLELFERAKKSNIIAVMDTGTGKTLIACLLIRHILSLEYERFPPPLPTTTISVTFKARSTMTKQIPLIRSMQGYVSHDIRNLTAQIHFDSTANAKDAAETFRKENLKIVYVKEKSDTGCSQEETKRVDANGKPIKVSNRSERTVVVSI